MKAKVQVFRIFQFVCLLTFASVWCEEDFKTEFGENFGEAMKQYNAELLKDNLDSLKVFYTNAIGDVGLSVRDERAFRSRLESIDIMKSRIGNTVTPETIRMMRNFSRTVLMELIMFRAAPKIKNDSEKSAAFDKAMKLCAEDEIKHVDKFIEQMRNKWISLYETIPAEELEKHAEYKDINDLIDELSNASNDMSEIISRTVILANVLSKISSFFGYTEWNALLLNTKNTI